MDPNLQRILDLLGQGIAQGIGIALPLAAFLFGIFQWLRGDVKSLDGKLDTAVRELHELDKRVVRLETLQEGQQKEQGRGAGGDDAAGADI